MSLPICCISSLMSQGVMDPAERVIIHIYIANPNPSEPLKSWQLLVILMYFSILTLGYMRIYMMYLHNQKYFTTIWQPRWA